MIQFENSNFLLLLFLVLFSIYFEFFYKKRKNFIHSNIFIWGDYKFKFKSYTMQGIYFVSIFLFYLSFTMLILALSNPYFLKKEKVYIQRGMDIMIVLDDSPSMAAVDFSSKNRFQIAKENIKRFIDKRKNDFIGLVGFARDAVLESPLTIDYDFLKKK